VRAARYLQEVGYRHSAEEILGAAVEETFAHGIGALTFRSVAARLGIPDRMVVYYFPTKTDLVLAVVQELGERLRALLASAFGEGVHPVEELTRQAWPALARPDTDPALRVYLEVIGLACAAQEPYASVAPRLLDGWVDWVAERVEAPSRAVARDRATAAVAQLDGLLIVRQLKGPRAANAAARALGILPTT
jgi:AcrR family transcriptional regulator